MTDNLNQDVCALKKWLSDAWRRISDPSITAYEDRGIRYYMKEAEIAVRFGLKRLADQETISGEVGRAILSKHRPEFRILQLEV